MSYNGSGTFNLAAGNPVVTATTISTTWANNTLSDVATGLSNVICRDGQSTTTASIGFAAGIAVTGGIARFPAGSVGSPSVYLSTDSTTGLYRSALNNLDVAVGGANVLNIAASAITMGSGVTFAAGAVTATTGTFTSTVTLSGTAANIATGSNYISNAGTDAGLSLDASNNATLSGTLTVSNGLVQVNGVTTADVVANAATDNYAELILKENGTLKWNIYNDYTTDALHFGTGGGSKANIDTSGNTTLSGTLTVSGASISTGSTTALSLATSGGTQFAIGHTASSVNYFQAFGRATGTAPYMTTGGESNIDMLFSSNGTGNIYFYTNNVNNPELAILHTTSSSRYITITGSEAGNPTIGVSGGSLALAGTTIVTGQLFSVDTDKIYLARGDAYSGSYTSSDAVLVSALTGVFAFLNNGEKARITAGGYFKASDDGAYYGATGSYHEMRSGTAFATTNSGVLFSFDHASDPQCVTVYFDASAPNDSTHFFINGLDTGATRFQLRANGGLANYTTNDVNLSDVNAKKIKGASADHTDFIEALDGKFKKYAYRDTTEENQELDGLTAQDLQAIAPELVTEFSDGQLGIYTHRLQERINSVIPRLIKRIKALEARL